LAAKASVGEPSYNNAMVGKPAYLSDKALVKAQLAAKASDGEH
jgi:hypothetical protein